MSKNVTVVGLSEIKANISRIKAQVKEAMDTTITQRTEAMKEDLLIAVTGSGRIIGADPTKGGGSPGTGRDVPGTLLEPGQISVVSGQLRASLDTSVSSTKNRVTGSVGFPKSFRSLGGAGSQGIDWPKNPATVNVVNTRRSSGNAPKRLKPSMTPASKYVPSVLLGTSKLLGRNVLRLALYEDIMRSKTLDTVKAAVRGALV